MKQRWRWRPGAWRILGMGVVLVAATGFFVMRQPGRGTPAAGPAGRSASRCATASGQASTAPIPTLGLSMWATFEGSAGHNLVLPGTTSSGDLAVSWTFHPLGEIGTAPTIVNGVAYITSLDHCVYALNAATGAEIWSFHADNESMSEPLVVDGRVFFGTGNKTVVSTRHGLIRGTGANTVYALSASTGRELWARNTSGENMPTVLYADGTVYAATGGREFYAIDAATGTLHWSLKIPSIVSMSSPVAWGHTAVVGGANPYAFYGVNLTTGKLAWRLPVSAEGGVDDVSPTVSGGVAFVQVPEGVYPHDTAVEWAINTQTGKNLWQRLLGTGVLPVSNKEETGVATVVGGTLYVGSPALHGLWALSAQTGDPVWKAPTALPTGVRASPTVVGNYVLAFGQGNLYVIDKATGVLLHTISVGEPTPGAGECASPAPTVVGQTVYFTAGRDATLVAEPLADVIAGQPPALGTAQGSSQ